MSILFKNIDLPESINSYFNTSNPLLKFKTISSNINLIKIDYTGKYEGFTFEEVELNNPNNIFQIYKIKTDFSTVNKIIIDGFIEANNISRFMEMSYFILNSDIYLICGEGNKPHAITAYTEFISPIPTVNPESIIIVPNGFNVDRIDYQGNNLDFGQDGKNVIINYSNNCCKLKGGEKFIIKGNQNIDPIKFANVYNFKFTNQKIGLIEYIEWRGERFERQQGYEIENNRFLWNSQSKNLNLICQL